jgi:adenosylcobyric acid synthase
VPGPLFIGGTASHVGKSWFTAAFCRLLVWRGMRVAPFKAQNMSNNSFPCIEGGEIGRAQAMQAEACGLPPMADMNPVLLKPQASTGSQVVRLGKVWRNVEASDYYRHSAELMQVALASYARLAAQFDFIVCEGAGSVAEVNLAARDFTNLRFAAAVSARALLVADIERGGVFAALVGTMDLLPPEERALVRAFAVNRFCGDPRLFRDGVEFLEERLRIPCLGVFPMTREIRLDEEDCVAIPDARNGAENAEVAVIRLPRISNFTDFRLFPRIAWIDQPVARSFRVIFLPGTKNTIEDLNWLCNRGLDAWLLAQRARGTQIVGVCGGYQMLGETIADPERLESEAGEVAGLGLLPVRTVLQSPKVTGVVTACVDGTGPHSAYEIHMGRTEAPADLTPFARLDDGHDGARADGIIGTYLHGIFEHAEVVRCVLGIDVPRVAPKTQMYHRLADWLVEHADPAVLEELCA